MDAERNKAPPSKTGGGFPDVSQERSSPSERMGRDISTLPFSPRPAKPKMQRKKESSRHGKTRGPNPSKKQRPYSTKKGTVGIEMPANPPYGKHNAPNAAVAQERKHEIPKNAVTQKGRTEEQRRRAMAKMGPPAMRFPMLSIALNQKPPREK